mmetsp:Transcript_21937/g.39447  ORF Transcript_21937/g.39447 Transcript_21937/m.39447 type:complete len:119 (+) Transcript_21937:507-863(+)
MPSIQVQYIFHTQIALMCHGINQKAVQCNCKCKHGSHVLGFHLEYSPKMSDNKSNHPWLMHLRYHSDLSVRLDSLASARDVKEDYQLYKFVKTELSTFLDAQLFEDGLPTLPLLVAFF